MGTTVTDEERFSPLPKAIRESNAELEAMFEEQRKAKEGLQPPLKEASIEEPIETPPIEEFPVETPPIEEPTETVDRAELEKAEHKYIVLQEKYNKEVPGLYRQNEIIYQTVQNLQQEIERLKAQPKPEKKPSIKISLRESPKIQALKAELSPEVFENLVGAIEETTESTRRGFEEEAEKLRGEISTTKEEISTSRVKDKNQIFWESVMGSHEDYEQLRDDPNFQVFLSQQEGLSGLTRGDFLIDAYNRRDSKTYIRYINAFKKESEGTPEKKTLGSSGLNPEKLRGKMGAPRSSGASTGEHPSEKKTMTKEEAQAEYDRIGNEFGKGLWEGREKEYDKKEAALVRIINSG